MDPNLNFESGQKEEQERIGEFCGLEWPAKEFHSHEMTLECAHLRKKNLLKLCKSKLFPFYFGRYVVGDVTVKSYLFPVHLSSLSPWNQSVDPLCPSTPSLSPEG